MEPTTAKERLALTVQIADLDLEIASLEQQLHPHLQHLDRLREQRLQALQEYAQSKGPLKRGQETAGGDTLANVQGALPEEEWGPKNLRCRLEECTKHYAKLESEREEEADEG